jgi:hypothetical protein
MSIQQFLRRLERGFFGHHLCLLCWIRFVLACRSWLQTRSPLFVRFLLNSVRFSSYVVDSSPCFDLAVEFFISVRASRPVGPPVWDCSAPPGVTPSRLDFLLVLDLVSCRCLILVFHRAPGQPPEDLHADNRWCYLLVVSLRLPHCLTASLDFHTNWSLRSARLVHLVCVIHLLS